MLGFNEREVLWLTMAGLQVRDDLPVEVQRSLYSDILTIGPDAQHVQTIADHIREQHRLFSHSTSEKLQSLSNLFQEIKSNFNSTYLAMWELELLDETVGNVSTAVSERYFNSFDSLVGPLKASAVYQLLQAAALRRITDRSAIFFAYMDRIEQHPLWVAPTK